MDLSRTGRRLAAALCSLAVVPAPGTAHAAAPAAAEREKRLKSWGDNRSGRLGDGTWTDFRATATTVLGLTGAEVVKIAAGGGGSATGHGPALLTDRTVQSWGANGSGRPGNGTTTDSGTPVTTPTALTGVDRTAAPVGGDFGLAN
ncbi:hypothetical protein ACIRBZ_03695 [Streptomyces sp. NPDC094038]|uniref:hypothetical protein n=1 Tax=Streptomyces sp. NPDC094038 TaxID=3366055 RepID=UPI00382D7C26